MVRPLATEPGSRLDRYLTYRARLDEWRAELLPLLSASDVGFLLYDMKLVERPSAVASGLENINDEDRARIEDYLLFGRRGWLATPMSWRAWTTLSKDDVDRALSKAVRRLRCAVLEVRSIDRSGEMETFDVIRGEKVPLFEPAVARAMKVGVVFSTQLLPFDDLTMTTGAPMAVGVQGSHITRLALEIVRDLLGIGSAIRPLSARESRKLAFIMLRTVFAVRKGLK